MKKNSKYLITSLLVTFIVFFIIKINPNQFYPSKNQVQDEWAGKVVENPQLSYAPNWTLDGVETCTASNDQYDPQICSDGAGGAIITWVDNRSGSLDIWAQKIDSSGEPEWGYDGRSVVSVSGSQFRPRICSDGVGGVIFAWVDARPTATVTDIYARRFDSNGVSKWSRSVCTASGKQNLHQICSDGSGGAIIAWRDARNGPHQDIYAQRIDFNGNIKWTTNGIAINTVSFDIGEDIDLEMCSDGIGGAIITWTDTRLPLPMYDYAQRINTNGVVQWTTNGIQVHLGDGFYPQVCSDGAGGAIIVWCNSFDDIYAQRLNSNGIKLWNIDGEAICTEISSQQWPEVTSDGSGGAIITWFDDRSGNDDIYAQLINSTGNIQWITDGEVVCGATYKQEDPQICSDGSGGAIITWEDFRSGVFDIYAQRIDSGGNAKWTNDGVAICKASFSQENPQICIDGSGGAIIAWQDYRSNTDYDIYAQRITNDIPTSSHPGDFITDDNGSETIDWTLYDDCGNGQYRIWANNTVGNSYVWVDWTSWKNNTLIIVPINRTAKGVYNYTIEYYDDQNQFGIPNTVIVTITDLSGPIITINSPIIYDLYSNDPPNFNVLIFDTNGIDSMWYGIVGSSMNVFFTSNGSLDQTLWNTVGNGLQTIIFYANDTFGNQNYENVVIEKDIIAPKITINAPKSNDEFTTNAPAYDISINEPHLDQIWYTLDGGITNISITPLPGSIDQIVWDGVSLGSVTLTFYANDTLGHIGIMSVGIVKINPSGAPFDVWNLIITGIIIISIAVAISLVIVRRGIKHRGIRVFISHAVKDYKKYQIADIAKYLQSQKGISQVYYCEEDLVGDIDDWMSRTVPRCQLLIFFSTENSNNSLDCINELRLALKYNIQITPVLGENIEWENLEMKWEDLKLDISRQLGKEFNFENIKSFRKELYDYVIKVKNDLEEEIRGKKRPSKVKKLK